MNRKHFRAAALATVAAIGITVAAPAAAQNWQPPGVIKLMIGFKAGGGADTQARLIAAELEARHGWKIIPEQVTGKGGLALASALAKQPADGSAIGLVVSETLAYNLFAASRAPVAVDDFTLLTSTARFQMGVVALTSRGWGDMRDVFRAAQAGETIRFGAMSPRLEDLAYLLGRANGVKFNIVGVRGGKAVMDGINAGDLDVGFAAGIQTKAVKAGRVVNLASALPQPLEASPDAPLFAELGLEYDADGFFMFIAPAGLPADARAALAAAIADIAADPDTEAGKIINRAFGGPFILQGAALDARIGELVAADRALLKIAAQ